MFLTTLSHAVLHVLLGCHRSDEVVNRVNDRISELSFIPKHYGEPLHVMYYERGQYFKGHLDSGDQPRRARNSRIATCYIYLSDAAVGGETYFPLAKKASGGRDSVPRACAGLDMIEVDQHAADIGSAQADFLSSIEAELPSLGVTVRPKKGRAVLWWNKAEDGEVDWRSRHIGCPVVEGEKWGAVRWIHHRPMER